MPKRVRQPIQVYLTDQERAELDRLATELGVSRSEVLRRGVAALEPGVGGTGPLAELAARGLVRPALLQQGVPPTAEMVAPLEDLLDGLQRDRSDR